MATKINIDGKNFTINKNTDPKVIDALQALVKAMSTRQWPIGMVFDHGDGGEYQLCRILQSDGTHRAYLINTETGVARNSRKVVKVIDAAGKGDHPRGYVEDLPAEKDRFINPDDPTEFIGD